LSKVILFGARSLRRALSDYVDHFHAERNHQGKGNVVLFPRDTERHREGPVRCRERLGGLLRYYHQEAARCRVGRFSILTLRIGDAHFADQISGLPGRLGPSRMAGS